MKIELELDVLEAHFLLPAISAARAEAVLSKAKAKTDTAREYADVRATVLGRIESDICDRMFPEPRVTEYL